MGYEGGQRTRRSGGLTGRGRPTESISQNRQPARHSVPNKHVERYTGDIGAARRNSFGSPIQSPMTSVVPAATKNYVERTVTPEHSIGNAVVVVRDANVARPGAPTWDFLAPLRPDWVSGRRRRDDFSPSRDGVAVSNAGGDVGALVVHVPSDMFGSDISLVPESRYTPVVSGRVERRSRMSGDVHAVIHRDLAPGSYTVFDTGQRVNIVSGLVSELEFLGHRSVPKKTA